MHVRLISNFWKPWFIVPKTNWTKCHRKQLIMCKNIHEQYKYWLTGSCWAMNFKIHHTALQMRRWSILETNATIQSWNWQKTIEIYWWKHRRGKEDKYLPIWILLTVIWVFLIVVKTDFIISESIPRVNSQISNDCNDWWVIQGEILMFPLNQLKGNNKYGIIQWRFLFARI